MFTAVYVFASVCVVITTAINAGFLPAFCAAGTSFISMIAVGGITNVFQTGDKAQKVGTSAIGGLALLLAYWFSTGFLVRLFGQEINGQVWGLIGGFTGFLSAMNKAKVSVREFT